MNKRNKQKQNQPKAASAGRTPVAAAATPPSGRWSALVIATVGALALLFVAVTMQKIWAADFWWQLRTGQWIVENRKLPTTDVYSFTVRDHVWVELRWMYCVLLYAGWKVGGATLLVLAQVGAIGAAFLTIIWPSRRVLATGGVGGWVGVLAAAMVASALLAGMFRWVLRPELVTLVFLAVYLVVLERFAAGKWRRAVWLLPVAQVIWTNSHTLFILGPVTAWMFVAGELGQWLASRVLATGRGHRSAAQDEAVRRLRNLAILASLVTGACWVNPWGHSGAMFPFILYREVQPGHVLARAITEFASPVGVPLGQWRWDHWMQLVLIGLVAATFVLNWRRTSVTRLVVFSAAAYLASMAQRNCSLLSIMGLWAGLRNLDGVEGLRPAGTRLGAAASGAAGWLVAALTLFCTWYVATDRYSIRQNALREFGVGIAWANTPRGAVEFMIREGVRPQVYHGMADAAYLIWRGSQKDVATPLPVYVDGRLEVYGDQFLKEHFEPAAGAVRFDALCERWGIVTAMVTRDGFEGLASRLAGSPNWALVYIDHRNMVFVRDIPEHRSLIERWRIDLSKTVEPRDAEPDQRAAGWRTALGAPGRAWYSDGLAWSFLTINSPKNALAAAERGVAAAPDDLRMWVTLGRAALGAKEWARAREALSRALYAGGPGGANDWAGLGVALEQAGDPKGAIAAYRRGYELDGTRFDLCNQIGILLARQLDLKEAERWFETSLRIKPDNKDARANLEFLRSQKR